MEHYKDWLFPTTPLSTILKARPLSISLCEKFRINPWNAMHCGLESICASNGIAWETFAEALGGLEIPDRDSDWIFPMARALEKRIYDRFIMGGQRNLTPGKIAV
jgi:hypothetical protein